MNKIASIKNYRLPKDLKPLSYDIFVQPYFSSITKPEYFDGKVKIKFRCISDTNKLVLHMNNLEIINSTLLIESESDQNYKTSANFAYNYDKETHFLTAELNAAQSFKANNIYSFSADFKGFLKDDNLGFYRSSYNDSDGLKLEHCPFF